MAERSQVDRIAAMHLRLSSYALRFFPSTSRGQKERLFRHLDLLAVILDHQGHGFSETSSDADIQKHIEAVFSGKRVFELGCRDGSFLRFLERHGAVVMGSAASGRVSLVNDSNVVEKPVERAGFSKKAASFNPDFIVSTHLFAKDRSWQKAGAPPPLKQLLVSLSRIARPGTLVYVNPSVALTKGSWFEEVDFSKIKEVSRLRTVDGAFSPFVYHFRYNRVPLSKKPKPVRRKALPARPKTLFSKKPSKSRFGHRSRAR